MQWSACSSCHRHVRSDTTTCPFCGHVSTREHAPSTGAFVCAVFGLMLTACVDRSSGEDSGPTTTDDSSSGSSSSTDDSSTSASVTATSVAAVTYAAPSPDPAELAAQQGTATDTEGDEAAPDEPPSDGD